VLKTLVWVAGCVVLLALPIYLRATRRRLDAVDPVAAPAPQVA
jgi:hypothetical protein